MPPLVADAGPGPQLVLLGAGCFAVAGLMLFSGLTLFGLWLARRGRPARAEPVRGPDDPPPGAD